MNKKQCTSCKIEKPVSDFYYRTGTKQYHSQCKDCERVLAKKWYKSNPQYAKEKAKKWRTENIDRVKEYRIANKRRSYIVDIKRKYNITELEFNNMLLTQKNKCIGCGVDFEFGVQEKTPHIDHCHKTGKVRGILCRKCNSVIGFYKDNPKPLFNLSEYLNCHGYSAKQ